MGNQGSRMHIGPRTIKTVVAVIIAMILVDGYGVSSSKLIFAMLGAMAAIAPTFKDSLESCLTQFVGVMFGAIMSAILLYFSFHPLFAIALGIIAVITLYNALGISYSPSLPCMIVVIMCTSSDIQPFSYAFERIWDSAIGLGVGLVINTLVLPYDNSQLIRSYFAKIQEELRLELEGMLVGGEANESRFVELCKELDQQINIYSKQVLLYKLKIQKSTLTAFQESRIIVGDIESYLNVLGHMEIKGTLNEENYQKLVEQKVNLLDYQPLEVDDVVNKHIDNVLLLLQELIKVLKKLE